MARTMLSQLLILNQFQSFRVRGLSDLVYQTSLEVLELSHAAIQEHHRRNSENQGWGRGVLGRYGHMEPTQGAPAALRTSNWFQRCQPQQS